MGLAMKAPFVLLMRRVHSHWPSPVVLESANSLFSFYLIITVEVSILSRLKFGPQAKCHLGWSSVYKSQTVINRCKLSLNQISNICSNDVHVNSRCIYASLLYVEIGMKQHIFLQLIGHIFLYSWEIHQNIRPYGFFH